MQQNIVQPVHRGRTHKAIPPAMGRYIWDCPGLHWAFLFPSPFSMNFSKVSWTTNLSVTEYTETHRERPFYVLWKWTIGRGDPSQQEIRFTLMALFFLFSYWLVFDDDFSPSCTTSFLSCQGYEHLVTCPAFSACQSASESFKPLASDSHAMIKGRQLWGDNPDCHPNPRCPGGPLSVVPHNILSYILKPIHCTQNHLSIAKAWWCLKCFGSRARSKYRRVPEFLLFLERLCQLLMRK